MRHASAILKSRSFIHVLLLLGFGIATSYGAVANSNSVLTGSWKAPSNLSYPSPQTYVVGAPIAPLLPTVTGNVTRYQVTPALPAGLRLDSITGRITGTPTATKPMTSYRVTAANKFGATSAHVLIAVVVPAPSALTYSSPQSYAVGKTITPLIPSVTGTVTNYSVAPALPSGLTLDPNMGVISGTPMTAAGTANYTITATNRGGTTTFALSITVINVAVASGNISRIVASGTSIDVAVVIRPLNFAFTGVLHAAAQDPSGIFRPNVATMASSDGSYTLTLTTASTAAANRYVSNVSIALCGDANCTVTQAVPSVIVPFDVNVISATSAWPGDNLSGLAIWPGASDWGTYQGNAAHTGYVPVAPNPDRFSTRWNAPATTLSSGRDLNLANLATSNDQFFVAGSNRLYARREFDGSQVWQYDFSGLTFPSANPPAVANGAVYIAAGQQSSTFMYAFDAANGSLIFKSPMSSQWEHYLAPTIGSNGVYTNAGTYGGLYAFTPAGQQQFFANQAQTSVWTPAVDQSGVYTYTGGYLSVLDPTTGTVFQSIFDPTFTNYIYEIGGSPVLGAPGSVFVANYLNSILNGGAIGNTLINFDLTTNSIRWQKAGVFSSTPAYHQGVLYVVNQNPLRLEARAEIDGALLWTWAPAQTGTTGFKSEVLLTDSLLFVSTNLTTYAIDVATHRPVWSYPLSGRLALSQNGILYIQGQSLLVAVNLK